MEAPRAAGISFIIVNDVEAVDHLGDIELEASIDISFVIVDEVEAVDLWKSRP